MAATPQPHEELVYAAAIPILADDLYPRKIEVVREYIQNASDALDAFARVADHVADDSEPQIKVSVHGKSLVIFDTGIGMDEEEINKLKRIAYSEKRQGEEAGYKGIGRLAGIAVAKKLLITSTSYGDPKLYKFEFRAQEMREELDANRRRGVQEVASIVINRHTEISTFDIDPTDHYTIVELREIDDRYPELLEPRDLRRFIGEIAPVGFAPDFTWGQRISEHLHEHVPDYSPKIVWLANAEGDRSQIYKPYNDAMSLAEPEFIKVHDPQDAGRLLAYCWYATRGKQMLGKLRPAGKRFTIDGKPDEKKSLAGFAYKLFGLSVGDRSLPFRTLWARDFTRGMWYTGEIHIVDKDIKPTTDRSDFIDNPARTVFYGLGRRLIAIDLDKKAQRISDDRKAFDTAEHWRKQFREFATRLKAKDVERADLNAWKKDIGRAQDELKRKCTEPEIKKLLREVGKEGRDLLTRIEAARSKKQKANEVNDLASSIKMTPQARKAYTIIMDAVEEYFRDDRETYYDLSNEIHKALKKRY